MYKHLFKIAIILIISYVVCGKQHKYAGYKIYTIRLKTDVESEVLMIWFGVSGIDVLSIEAGYKADIMVAPDIQYKFEEFLEQYNYDWHISGRNIDRLIETFNKKRARRNRNKADEGNYSFDDYQRHEVMNEYLDLLGREYPKFVTVKDEGLSYENRTIKSIRISGITQENENKVTMLIECGIHAREWMSSTFCMYLINELTENRSENIDMLNRIDWLIVPLLNPDGYEYTHTSEDILWRKSRRPDDLNPECKGADLNRNFPYEWGEEGTSDDPCSDIFRGRIPFSEPETRLIATLMMIETKINPGRVGYLSVHSFGSLLLYPWGYSKYAPPPSSTIKLQEVSNKIVNAVYEYSGNTYVAGTPSNLLYDASGISIDFAAGTAGLELAFVVELPPAYNFSGIFDEDKENDNEDDHNEYNDFSNSFDEDKKSDNEDDHNEYNVFRNMFDEYKENDKENDHNEYNDFSNISDEDKKNDNEDDPNEHNNFTNTFDEDEKNDNEDDHYEYTGDDEIIKFDEDAKNDNEDDHYEYTGDDEIIKFLLNFFPSPENIKPICQETMILVKEMGKYLADNYL